MSESEKSDGETKQDPTEPAELAGMAAFQEDGKNIVRFETEYTTYDFEVKKESVAEGFSDISTALLMNMGIEEREEE